MSKSNVTIRSNVFVRRACSLEDDRAFVSQVRGHELLLHLLARLEPGADPVRAARRHFSLAQLAQVAWQARCGHCDALPEGPVLRADRIEVQFRCPRNVCPAANYTAKTVLIDVALVRLCDSVFKKSVAEVVQDALRNPPATSGLRTPVGDGVQRVPVTVRLTLTQRYFYTDHDIEQAVGRLLTTRGRE